MSNDFRFRALIWAALLFATAFAAPTVQAVALATPECEMKDGGCEEYPCNATDLVCIREYLCNETKNTTGGLPVMVDPFDGFVGVGEDNGVDYGPYHGVMLTC